MWFTSIGIGDLCERALWWQRPQRSRTRGIADSDLLAAPVMCAAPLAGVGFNREAFF